MSWIYSNCRLLNAILRPRIKGINAINTVNALPIPNTLYTRNLSTTRQLKGLVDFFEKGQSLPIFEPDKAPIYGRAWKADELRLKSFEDLHKLWFILLKERNLLATQKAEAQRLGQRWFGTSRIFKASLSMARIKTVLLERQRIHNKAKHLLAIKVGHKPIPTEGDTLLDLQKGDRLRLLERRREFRKKKRFIRRQHPLLS